MQQHHQAVGQEEHHQPVLADEEHDGVVDQLQAEGRWRKGVSVASIESVEREQV